MKIGMRFNSLIFRQILHPTLRNVKMNQRDIGSNNYFLCDGGAMKLHFRCSKCFTPGKESRNGSFPFY
jgi:hypothetical protein